MPFHKGLGNILKTIAPVLAPIVTVGTLGLIGPEILGDEARKEGASAARNQAEANRVRAQAERRTAKIRQRIQERTDRSSRISALRSARKQRADIITAAEGSSVSRGSSAIGAIGAARATFATQLKAALQTSKDTREITDVNIDASKRAQGFINVATENKINQDKKQATAGLFGSIRDIFGKVLL